MLNGRLFVQGVAIWAVATAFLRVAGQWIFDPERVGPTVVLFVVAFPAMYLVTRMLCRVAGLPRNEWPDGACERQMRSHPDLRQRA